MPQKKKSKTKKQLKKSINSLWKSLQDEKAKHAKASDIIGHMKQELAYNRLAIEHRNNSISQLRDDMETAANREEHTTEVMADFFKALT